MDKARSWRAGTGGNTGVCPQPAVVPVDSAASDPHRIPGQRFKELKETPEHEDGLGSQDSSDLKTVGRKESSSSPPAAKRQKRDAKGKKERKWKVDEADAQKMKRLMLSEEQLNRYEVYRRSAFPRAAVNRLMRSAASTSVPQTAVIAMAGLAKVFVGEVVEEALDVCEKWGEAPPLQPKHLREAVRRLSSKGKIPKHKPKPVLF
ncbi:transcription initiation factor TFIID subunit 11-like [Molossus molossus]|uniref:transcription initiation factor TFIID subunit 11-like n=1 Tax=Molossus molossus TaxID=27622 RepID=UPI001745D7C5|nr:transcription initiation factor TFIID subunit 11-like [Molossus molossus]